MGLLLACTHVLTDVFSGFFALTWLVNTFVPMLHLSDK